MRYYPQHRLNCPPSSCAEVPACCVLTAGLCFGAATRAGRAVYQMALLMHTEIDLMCDYSIVTSAIRSEQAPSFRRFAARDRKPDIVGQCFSACAGTRY